MKNNRKTILIILAIIIVVCCALCLFLVIKQHNKKDSLSGALNTINNSNVSNTNKENSKLWINNYKNLPIQKSTCMLRLFGNEQTIGLTTPIDLRKLNEFVATYKYYPYNSINTVETSNLNNINDNAVSTIYARDEYNSLLFEIELYGDGLSFRECIEQGKFLIRAQGDLTKGRMNISASQLGINIQNEDEGDASKILDAIIDSLGAPTYIVAHGDLEQLTSTNEFDISYKLIYKYDKYAIAFYIEEEIQDNNKRTCEITHVYYYPIEFFNNLDITDNNYFKYRLK